MNTTKKLLVVVMAALVAAVSFVPSTFSWYNHNDSAEGYRINYNDDKSISIKSASNTVSMNTYKIDANGDYLNASNKVVQTAAAAQKLTSGLSIAPNNCIYYRTILENSGSNDVMVDLNMNNMTNNADFFIGTVSPTINEKAFAAKAERSKKSDDTVRVYFKTYSGFSAFWAVDNGDLDSDNTVGSSNNTTNDINLAYTIGDEETKVKMHKCDNSDATTYGGTTKVYYYDVPSNADSFYFFNHWYMISSSNREWNRTKDITNLTPGVLYYLNGEIEDSNNKTYKARPVDTNLLALNSYYDSVRMSTGASVFADIGLKKENDNDDEEFTPDYYGKSITYSSSDTAVATINIDGVITPKSSGNATITTIITSKFGDTRSIETKLTIPSVIEQVPIAQNIKVPAASSGGKWKSKYRLVRNQQKQKCYEHCLYPIKHLINATTEKKKKENKENKVLRTIRLIKNIIFAVILITLVGIIVLTVVTRISGKTPSIMGYTMYRVSSGSMTPTLKVGDIILCRECDPMTLQQGDIITYDGRVGQFAGMRVTHRVVKPPYKENGNYYLITKGDDNPTEDSPVELGDVKGIFIQKVDLLRSLYDFFLTPWGLLAIIALIILAFFNELVLFIRALIGKGFETVPEESVEDIIERYAKENTEKSSQGKTKDSQEQIDILPEVCDTEVIIEEDEEGSIGNDSQDEITDTQEQTDVLPEACDTDENL